jgi:hypothetical protein
MPSAAIHTILSTDANITAIVGNRITPVLAHFDGTRPSIVYHIISTVPTDFKQGPSDIDFIRVQIDSYAPGYDTVINLGRMIREALDRYPHSTVSGVNLAGVSYLNGFNTYEDGAKLHRRIDEYQFRIRRTLAT